MNEIEPIEVIEFKQKLLQKEMLYYSKMLIFTIIIQVLGYFFVDSPYVAIMAGLLVVNILTIIIEILLIPIILFKWFVYKRNQALLNRMATRKV